MSELVCLDCFAQETGGFWLLTKHFPVALHGESKRRRIPDTLHRAGQVIRAEVEKMCTVHERLEPPLRFSAFWWDRDGGSRPAFEVLLL